MVGVENAEQHHLSDEKPDCNLMGLNAIGWLLSYDCMENHSHIRTVTLQTEQQGIVGFFYGVE